MTDHSIFDCSTCDKTETSIYWTTRLACGLLLLMMIPAWALVIGYGLASSASIIQPFAVNTFLPTYTKGPNAYTWIPFSPGEKSVYVNFLECTQIAQIFPGSPDWSNNNGTEYITFVETTYPTFASCAQQVTAATLPVFPFDSVSEALLHCVSSTVAGRGIEPQAVVPAVAVYGADYTYLQKQSLEHCMRPEQAFLYDVLQDQGTEFYLGSYNAAVCILIGLWFMVVFSLYTLYVPSYLDDIGRSEGEMRSHEWAEGVKTKEKPSTVLATNRDYFSRTGVMMTLAAAVLSAALLIPLMIFAFRKQDITKDIYEKYTPFSTQNLVLGFAFSLAGTYYFAMDYWEKVFLLDSSDSANKVNLKPTPLKLLIPSSLQVNNPRALIPLLVFPFQESHVFFDAVMFIGLLGLQADVSTLEITQIFQALMYSALIGIAYAYTYYAGYDVQLKPQYSNWNMSLAANMASFLFALIPMVLIWLRFSDVSKTSTVHGLYIAYGAILAGILGIRFVSQLYMKRPMFLGWMQLWWALRLFLHVLAFYTIFLLQRGVLAKNDDLRAHVGLWLVNY